MTGWRALFYKEVLRFWKVGFQTVGAPVLTSVLYLLIFGHVLEDHVKVYDGVSYTAFLIPGLVMMSVLQNAFANSSSSMVQSKIMGNLVFLLLTPLSHWSWFFCLHLVSRGARRMAVGMGVLLGNSLVCLAIVGAQFFLAAARALVGLGVCFYRCRHAGRVGIDCRVVG
jgi:ABC-2 type transport system permease protein